jgi:heme-degrading monooxygenase HmoA
MILVVFRSRVRTELFEEIAAFDSELRALAKATPGFVDYKDFAAEDGEFVTLVRFTDADSLRAWRENPRHREAIRLGFERWMSSYDISVCDVQRHYTRDDRVEAIAAGAPVPGSVPVWDPSAA